MEHDYSEHGICRRCGSGKIAAPCPGERVAISERGVGSTYISILEILFLFKGRISRSEYWKGFLILLLFDVLSYYLYDVDGSDGARAIAMILGLISLWPNLAVFVKRWHDRDRSAWWLLVLPIPLLNVLFLIWAFIENGFLKGTDGSNRFGQDPLRRQESPKHRVKRRARRAARR